MRNKKQSISIVPRGAVQPCVAECAATGEACSAVNVRECDDALHVVGSPSPIGTIPTGHRLLLVDGNRHITVSGQQVMCEGQVITTLDGELVGAHRIGPLVVIITTSGIVWLHPNNNGYTEVHIEDACPHITLSALENSIVSAGLDAITFNEAYANWPATLSGSDVASLSNQLRRAWNEIQMNVDSAGAYAGLLRVRVGLRLIDDTYMWLSEPVTLGSDTLADSQHITTDCNLDGTAVTGIPATSLTRHRYRVGITVTDGIADEWAPLIKAVDILATSCLAPVNAGGTAQYRCIGIGGNVRRPRLEFGLPAIGEGALTNRLAQMGWHVIATTSDLAALAQRQWVSDAVAPSGNNSYVVTREVEQTDRLSATQADEVSAAMTPLRPVSSMTCNGRLYCIDGDGVLAVSAVGNALVTARQQAITGAKVRAIMPLSQAIYSNGFGRYPIVLFTDEGIYALPQTTSSGVFGEARLLNRAVIAVGSQPVEGDRDLYFNNVHGYLCRLRGSELTVAWRDCGMCQLAWDDVHRELWALNDDGLLLALMPSGRVSHRTMACVQLYDDATHGLAVTASGQVMDLAHEQSVSTQRVYWQSHPIAHSTPSEVVWQVMGNGTLMLEVTGERGISCHGFLVGRLQACGQLNAPLRQRLVSPPLRTVRLSVSGTCTSGTLLLPVFMG